MEDDLNEVNSQDDCDQLLETDIIISVLQEVEVTDQNVLEFLLCEFENEEKDISHLIEFEDLVFIVIVSEENDSELVNNNSYKYIPRAETFILSQKPLVI